MAQPRGGGGQKADAVSVSIFIHNTLPEAALKFKLLALVQRNRDSPGRDVRRIVNHISRIWTSQHTLLNLQVVCGGRSDTLHLNYIL